MKEVLGVKLYAATEAAELLSISERTLRAYIQTGRLRAQKIGGEVLISEENLQAFLQGKVPPPAFRQIKPNRHINTPVY